jgi:hypothetical protein
VIKGGFARGRKNGHADYPAIYRARAGRGFAAILVLRLQGAGFGREVQGSMADGDKKIRRTLHFRFTIPGASEQMIAMIKSAAPLYQVFGEAQVRLLQNVDDPGRFLQEIEYDAPEALELNRQQLASDPRVQAYLQAWRSMLPGAIEIDVYKIL